MCAYLYVLPGDLFTIQLKPFLFAEQVSQQLQHVHHIQQDMHLLSCCRVQKEVAPDGQLELSLLEVVHSQVAEHGHVGLESICHECSDLQSR